MWLQAAGVKMLAGGIIGKKSLVKVGTGDITSFNNLVNAIMALMMGVFRAVKCSKSSSVLFAIGSVTAWRLC